MRIWRHARQSQASSVLIYSPDTDIYNIGIGIYEEIQKDIIVQINIPSKENKYLYMSNLTVALKSDPDLAMVNPEVLNRIMQTLYIATGCDYISYFKTIGKKTFLDTYYQHASFINGSRMPGCLSQTYPGNKEQGFLAFLRLVGTVYFRKHISTFSSRLDCQTPNQLYNSISNHTSVADLHNIWFTKIRNIVSTVINTEEERVPSHSSLWRHWLRTCWISMMWQHSTVSDVYGNLPKPEESGWVLNADGTFSIDWESPEIAKNIQKSLDYLIKGCACKKGCASRACGCKKKGQVCGPSCVCYNCVNNNLHAPTNTDLNTTEDDEDENRDDNDDETDDCVSLSDGELEYEIITDEMNDTYILDTEII